MTIQQEAYQLIDNLPEDSVRIIIQLMQRMRTENKENRQDFRFADFISPLPTERALCADEHVRKLREHDRV